VWNSVGGKILMTIVISMVPVLELRGAIPIATAHGLNFWVAIVCAIIGNLIPVPFIIFLFRPVIEFLEKTKLFGKLARKLKKRTTSKMSDMDKKNKYKLLGLYLFVAIPLPGTGAWTGSAIAALMKMRIKHSFVAIAAGVVSAGLIMLVGSKLVEWIINAI